MMNDIRKRITWSNPIVLLIIVGIILFAAVIGMLLIRAADIDTDITAKTTNVGLVITNKKDDANYCQTHYDSLMNISDELNLDIFCIEDVPENEACLQAMKELIEIHRCKVIIAASFGYGEYVKELAELYPEICFIHPTGNEALPNMTTCMGRMYQARYLAGIVAGMRTDTGEIGYTAAFPISEVILQINAFTRGVRSVAPDANVHVIYCGSWVDDDAAMNASEKLLEKHPNIDILTMHTNSLMPDRVAEDNGIYSIGFNKDNAELFPDSYLTACIWRWDESYKELILSCLQGKFYGTNNWISMEDGIVALSELTENCAPGTQEAVNEAIGLFDSREFDVFYGPVADSSGTLRVPYGESMSDEEMRERFDWYVEGVSVEE